MPTEAELERALRKVIQAHNKSGSSDAISVNVVRARAEQQLGLDEDFFKTGEWKAKSKDIIHNEFEAQAEPDTASPNAKKRSSPSPPKLPAKKKAKLALDDDQDDSTALSDPPDSEDASPQPAKKAPKRPAKKPPVKPKSKSKLDQNDEMSDVASKPAKSAAAIDDDDSSELSSVLDEPLPKKKQSKPSDTKAKAKPKSTAKAKGSPDSDPLAEEIKRLQGWLVKCGIRKVWGKELKPFVTQKAKIEHLKSMLADVGMTGRYSNEKAAAIREQRELQADIEAVQEGNEMWGKDADEQDDESRPRKRLVRGAQNYDFLSSDGEETD